MWPSLASKAWASTEPVHQPRGMSRRAPADLSRLQVSAIRPAAHVSWMTCAGETDAEGREQGIHDGRPWHGGCVQGLAFRPDWPAPIGERRFAESVSGRSEILPRAGDTWAQSSPRVVRQRGWTNWDSVSVRPENDRGHRIPTFAGMTEKRGFSARSAYAARSRASCRRA